MTTRRTFIATTAATAALPFAADAGDPAARAHLLPATLRVRRLHAEPVDDYWRQLRTDGPETPQPLVRAEVLDAAFGLGTHHLLTQPDHWRLIAAGMFAGADLYTPDDPADPATEEWEALHHPVTEAHDMLFTLLRDGLTFEPMETFHHGLQLRFNQHPCTPRYVTASIPAHRLEDLAEEIAARTQWIVLDPDAA